MASETIDPTSNEFQAAHTLSMAEFERLLDQIVRSKESANEKCKAASELFERFTGDSDIESHRA
jgi:hypothetical protein